MKQGNTKSQKKKGKGCKQSEREQVVWSEGKNTGHSENLFYTLQPRTFKIISTTFPKSNIGNTIFFIF